MRFLDSSNFLYSYIKPRRRPPPEVEDDKRRAQGIIRRVQDGERVTTTVVHMSETANILEARAPLEDARSMILDILNMDTIKVTAVDSARYARAVQVAETHDVGTNDALAYVTMSRTVSARYTASTNTSTCCQGLKDSVSKCEK